MIRAMQTADALLANLKDPNTPDDEVRILLVRISDPSNHSTPRASISSCAASATKPDIIYTLDIDNEIPQCMDDKSAVLFFCRVEMISENSSLRRAGHDAPTWTVRYLL